MLAGGASDDSRLDSATSSNAEMAMEEQRYRMILSLEVILLAIRCESYVPLQPTIHFSERQDT